MKKYRSISCKFFDKLLQPDIPIRDIENEKNATKIKDDVCSILTKFDNRKETVPGKEIEVNSRLASTSLLQTPHSTLVKTDTFQVFLFQKSLNAAWK